MRCMTFGSSGILEVPRASNDKWRRSVLKASNEKCNGSVVDTRAFSGQFLLIFEAQLYSHHWDHLKCPNQRGVHNNIILGVVLYTSLCSCDNRQVS